MEYRVLGSLQIRSSDAAEWRDIPGRAQRRLAAILALHTEHVVTADLLEEHLHLSPGAVRTSVCRLRHLLGDDAVRTVPSGYQLICPESDAARFEDLVAHAVHARADVAQRDLEEALALWHGRPFDEFADEPWAQNAVARLMELHRTAIEDLAELRLEDGDPRAALALLEPLLDEDPFRDRARSQMIRAHVATDHPIEALHAFRDYRALLAAELGTEPSARLISLERAVAMALETDDGGLDPIVEAVEVIALGLGDGPGKHFAASLHHAVRAERLRARTRTLHASG